MLLTLGIDALVSQIQYKVGNLKKAYTDVSKLEKQTGQGVEPDSELGKNIWKHFLLHQLRKLSQIWGENKNL